MRPATAFLLVVALLAGCIGTVSTEAPPTAAPKSFVQDSSRSEGLAFHDSFSATPLMPYKKEFPFHVGPGVLEVRVALAWSSPASDITLQLLDPAGTNQGSGVKESSTTRGVATVDPPTHGAWKLAVASTRAIQESFVANLTLTQFVPGTSNLTQVVTVGAQAFAEINLIMEGNQSFDYSWATREAGAAKFNIHSHENGETTYHTEGTFAKTNGSFTAPKRQIYSLMWENTGVTPLTIDLDVTGQFRVHSHN